MESIAEEVVGAAGAAGGSSGESPAKVNKATSNFVQEMAEKIIRMTETLRRRNTAEVKYQMKALSEQCDEIAAGTGASASPSASWENTNGKPKQSQRKKYKVNVQMENLKNIMKSERALRSGEIQKLIENNQPLDGKKMRTGFELGGGGGELDSARCQNDSGEGEATTSDPGDGGDDVAAEKPPSDIWDLMKEKDRMLDELITGNPAIVVPTQRAFLEGGAVLQNVDFDFSLTPFAFPFETEPQISMDPNGEKCPCADEAKSNKVLVQVTAFLHETPSIPNEVDDADELNTPRIFTRSMRTIYKRKAKKASSVVNSN